MPVHCLQVVGCHHVHFTLARTSYISKHNNQCQMGSKLHNAFGIHPGAHMFAVGYAHANEMILLLSPDFMSDFTALILSPACEYFFAAIKKEPCCLQAFAIFNMTLFLAEGSFDVSSGVIASAISCRQDRVGHFWCWFFHSRLKNRCYSSPISEIKGDYHKGYKR